jgi:amino acid adenylation domain-containing protein
MSSAEASFACAPMQAGLLYETLSGAPGSYTQQVLITCREELEPDALRRAWIELVRRHDALRTSFIIGASTMPRQRVHDDVELGIVIADWRADSEPARESRWQELLLADRQVAFEPAQAPLMRVVICQLANTETRMLWSYHHSILDGRSRVALLGELFDIYAEKPLSRGASANAKASFAQFAEWAAGRGGDPATEAFWRDVLGGIDEPTPAPGARSTNGDGGSSEKGATGRISRRLDARVTTALRAMASAHALTPATVLQGAYGLLLAQEADSDDLLFATTRAGRRSPPFDVEDLVGLLMVSSPVRLQLRPQETVREWLTRVREFNMAVRDFEHAPLSEMRRWSALARSRPIAETLFSYENASMNTVLRAADPAWQRRDVELIEQLNFPLTIETFGDDEIAVNVLYDERLIPGDEAARITSRYEELVRACVAEPQASVASICELSPARRRMISGELTAFRAPVAAGLVPARIRGQIRSHPERIAVEHGEERVDYATLGARADGLAAHLVKAGAGEIVGIAMARTPDMVAAVLAVHRIGAAYLPLDPRYPTERLAFMVEDCGAKAVLTDAASQGSLPRFAGCSILDVDALPAAHPGGPPTAAVAPDQLSHVIYTSGSTGIPKAVMIEHHSVAHLTAWSEATFSAEERDGMLGSTSLSFDLSVFELLATLALGGRVVLVENILALSDPDFAGDVVFVNSVPSALAELLRTRALPPSVQTVALAGEALPAELVERLYAQPSVRDVWNLYGPTEDTTYSTAYRCTPRGRPLIGRPLPGTQSYVVDRHLRPVPEGVSGELLLGGIGLARGYLGRAELTAERFPELTFSGGDPLRVYRTGDLVCWTNDGLLDFRGRLDDQVKVRGVRVEPGELEHALRNDESIADAAVIARGEGAERRLAAYVVGTSGAPPDVAQLRDTLASRLPGALLPSAIFVLDALPLTPNGKLDRRALPEASKPAAAGKGGEATGATERVLADLWREVLDISGPIGSGDDFFALGGDSLSALALLGAVEERLNRRLSVGALIAATTLAEQAAAIESARSRPPASTLVPLRSSGTRRPWICVLTDQRGVVGLRNVLPAMLTDQPVYAMQAIDPAVQSWRGSSVQQIASACLRPVRALDPKGPYRLGGHSLGGLVAFEMACMLIREGARVELVLLIDTVAPEGFRWLGRTVARDRTVRHASLARRARAQAGLVRDELRLGVSLIRGRRPLQSWPRGFDDPWDQAGAWRIMRRYRPSRLAAPVTVLHTSYSETVMGGPRLGWARHVNGPITTRPVSGTHESMFSAPAVQDLAVALAAELDKLEPGALSG